MNLPPPPPPPPPPQPQSQPAGWYPDPWRQSPWRWWDGASWSWQIAAADEDPPAQRKRRLPAWLSVPVLCTGPLVLALVVYVAFEEPQVVPLAFVPLALLVPVWLWIDRLGRQPWSERLHALLWGATVAVAGGLAVGAAALWLGNEPIAMVVGAPLGEEAFKGLAIVWAVRRNLVHGALDGLVYACWAATGFAMLENVLYFVMASDEDALAQVFVVRGIVTPFAHPLFTMWIGIAVGMAVAKRRKLLGAALWGWLAAMAAHAIWNGSLVSIAHIAEERDETVVGLLALVVVAVLGGMFALGIVIVVRIRNARHLHYLMAMPRLLFRYGIAPQEVGMFVSWSQLRQARRGLSREQRRRFDRTHAALARLAALHAQPAPFDLGAEHRLLTQLHDARNGR